MAYQTLPNTFVSGGTIYSTAVSANMVALLQGYTTGNYDGWFRDMNASGSVSVGANAVIASGGTATFAAVSTTGTLTVGGAAIVTGDIYSTAWTTWTPTRVGGAGWSVSASSGMYKKIGKTVFCEIGMYGKATSDGEITVSLPVTASTYYCVYALGTAMRVRSVGGSAYVVGNIAPTPSNNNAVVSNGNPGDTFVSGTTYFFGTRFSYETD